MSPRAVAHVVFRHKRKMLVVMAVSLALGGGWAKTHPPQWRAEAGLLVEGHQADAAAALAALLRSRDLHREVVAGFGARLLPNVAEADRVEAFAHHLAVTQDGQAGLVRLRLDGAEADAAAAALAALVETARTRNAGLFAGGDDPGRAAAASAAAAARDKLTAWHHANGLFDLAAERSNLVTRRSQIESEATAAEAEAAAQADKLVAIQGQLAKTPAVIELTSDSDRSRVLEEAKSKLFELSTKEQDLLGKYLPSSPFVQAVQTEKRQVEQLVHQYDTPVAGRVERGSNPVHQALEQESDRAEAALATAKARGKALERQKTEIDRRLDGLAGSEQQMRQLEQAVADAESRLTAGRPTGPAAAVTGIGVLERAAAGTHPIGAGPRGILAAAFAVGLILALLVAALAERWSRRLSTPAEVERQLGLAVLTTIPREG